MKFTHSVLSFVFPLLFVSNVWSDDQTDHKEHHPASATASAKSAATVPVASASKNGVKKVDDQMKMMQDMHEKMMNAKSPEERNALMGEHMKVMQDGMSMMKNMGADSKSNMQGGMHKDKNMYQMMEKRMEMMETMMQMMIDRMPAAAPAMK